MVLRPLSLLTLAAVAALSLGACSKGADGTAPATAAASAITVSDAVVKANPNPAAPSAAYFTIHGGATAGRLVAVGTVDATRAEMHESKMEGGMMSMGTLTGVDVPAGGTVAFRQGGMHVMLFGIKAAALAAKKVTLTLGFADGHSLDVEAPIEDVGGAAGGMAAHDGMSGEHDGH